MAAFKPHQPLLLRLLHGAVALLLPLAWLSGLAVLLVYDHRWFNPGLSLPGNWIDIHGSIAVVLWPLALLFGLYALTWGRFRLRQPANAAALASLALAVGSGKLMDEDWLIEGNLDHLVYNLHVLAWALLAIMVIWHLTSQLRRGGMSLAMSMFSFRLRKTD